jgi:hypothetical protein
VADAVPLFGFDLSSGLQLIVEQSFGAAAAAVPAAAQFMNVTVPPGVSSGQTVCVQTPAGMSVTAVVPAGVGAGQVFQLAIPTAPPPPPVVQAVAVASPQPTTLKRSFSIKGLQMQGGGAPRDLPTVQAEAVEVVVDPEAAAVPTLVPASAASASGGAVAVAPANP